MLSLKSDTLDRVSAEMDEARQHDATSLQAAYSVPFEATLGYDPATAVGLDLIQGSALRLNDAELALLESAGFVILRSKEFPSFPYGYATIYGEDLPVFVSADMVLEAVHRSFDDILMALERAMLVPRVQRLLGAMRSELARGVLTETVARDADFFLSVAYGLLTGSVPEPVTALSRSEVEQFVEPALAGAGEAQVTLYGVTRNVDFSQFKPRGHYAGDAPLERYFRAMMWMGRIDFRMIETKEDGSRVFWRRQVDAAFGLKQLMTEASLADWQSVDRAISAFVGEHDYMHLGELEGLLSDLGVTSASELGSVPDERIAQTIIEGRYGEQRILSHIIRRVPGTDTFPLNASFAFFGQRYVVDSHVFSNVVYDRVATRVLPDPLDAAFAALGNDQAVSLLASELQAHPYAGNLAAMRKLVDNYDASYWQSSLYTSWLDALRTLSPALSPEASVGLPAVARTEPWGRRLLNAQLASWAQLRHDTILYAKQSYTSGSVCEFPDAYVDPYPEFFNGIARFAELGLSVTGDFATDPVLASAAERFSTYFGTLREISGRLAEMAELQRTGMPHSAEHVAFINQAIRVQGGGSGDPWQTGWYKDLFFDQAAALKFDPTIADVHTDAGGDFPVLRSPSVLHVATGRPRVIVMTVDSCQGPRAYAGLVSAYHEHLAQGFTRLTDQEWQPMVTSGPPDVPWMESVLGPR